jgi:outer membrane protein assembly factor BamB
VVGGTVYVASGASLFALNASTGAQVWVAGCACGLAALAVVKGVVYANAPQNALVAFNAGTGSFLWKTSFGDFSGYSAPSVANGVVYLGFDTGYLCAFAAIGLSLYWCHSTNPGGPNFYSINGTASVALGVASVGNRYGRMTALNASSAATLWTTDLSSSPIRSSPAIANGVLYVGSEDGKLYALNAASGAVLWSAATGGAVDSSPAVSEGSVYVGSSDGKLYAFHLP